MLSSTLALALLFSSGAAESVASDPDFVEARKLYDHREDAETHKRSAKLFYDVAKRQPQSLEAQIWCARTSYYAAHRYRDSRRRMRDIAVWGAECADTLDKNHPGDYNGQIWALLARSKYIGAKNIIPRVSKVERVLKKLESLVRKNPSKPDGYMLLGALYRELPGWPMSIGDEEKGLKLHLKGTSLAPNHAEMLLQLGSSYLAVGNDEAARDAFEKCAKSGTGDPDLEWETADARAWAKKMLEEID